MGGLGFFFGVGQFALWAGGEFGFRWAKRVPHHQCPPLPPTITHRSSPCSLLSSFAHALPGPVQVRYEENPALSAAVGSFPARVDASRAHALGLTASHDAASLVRAYVEDFPSALAPGLELLPPPPVSDPSHGPSRTVALITGGGTGIGKAVALRLARAGWQRDGTRVALVLTGRRRQPLEDTVAEIAEITQALGVDVDAIAWCAPGDRVPFLVLPPLFFRPRLRRARIRPVSLSPPYFWATGTPRLCLSPHFLFARRVISAAARRTSATRRTSSGSSPLCGVSTAGWTCCSTTQEPRCPPRRCTRRRMPSGGGWSALTWMRPSTSQKRPSCVRRQRSAKHRRRHPYAQAHTGTDTLRHRHRYTQAHAHRQTKGHALPIFLLLPQPIFLPEYFPLLF